MVTLSAVGVSTGLGKGFAYVLRKKSYVIPNYAVADTQSENRRFEVAFHKIVEETRHMLIGLRADHSSCKTDIMDAYLTLLEDPATTDGVRGLIAASHNAVFAVHQGFGDIIRLFDQMEDDYMRERAYDIQDMQSRLIGELLGVQRQQAPSVPPGAIIVAEDLSTSDTVTMNLENVCGIITILGGQNSHTSIVARSMEIPAVVGAEQILDIVKDGDELLLNGGSGLVLIHPTTELVEQFCNDQKLYLAEKAALKNFAARASATKDGLAVTVCANISAPGEATRLASCGAEGIGLFRTEFLFKDDHMPTEQDQYQAYRDTVTAAGGKNVLIRTMDLGGEKKFSPFFWEEEVNPALGYRAIRIHLDHVDLLKTQLRAILRASAHGSLGIKFPMISSVEELHRAKAILEAAKAELRQEGLPFDEAVKIGIMVEIPAAVLVADQLASECDFFSIGTNDLIQYTLAADRSNRKVAHLYTHYHPAVLRLIAMAIQSAHRGGIPCAMCGEAAGDPLLVPVFLGMGLDSFSTNMGQVLRVRSILSGITTRQAKALAEEISALATATDIKNHLVAFAARNS